MFRIISIICLLSLLLVFSSKGQLPESTTLWLEASSLGSSDLDEIPSWSTTIGNFDFQGTGSELPNYTASTENDFASVNFNSNGHFVYQGSTDLIGGNSAIILFFKPSTQNYTILAKGRAQSTDSQNSDVSFFPFSDIFRIRWDEDGETRSLDPPNFPIDSVLFMRLVLDRSNSEARLYVNETLLATTDCSPTYNLGESTRSLFVGSYQLAPQFTYNGVLYDFGVIKGEFDSIARQELLLYMGFKYTDQINLGDDIVLQPDQSCAIEIASVQEYESFIWSTGETSSSIIINAPGKYSVLATDEFGFLTTDTIDVGFGEQHIDEQYTLCSYDSLLWDLELQSGYTYTWSDGLETTESFRYLSPGSSYSVEVSNGFCSTTTPTVTIESDTYSETVELTESSNFCLGNDLFLTSGLEEAETYLWSTNEETPIIQPQISGEYWVETTNANGCIGRDTIDVDIVGVTPDVNWSVPSLICPLSEVAFEDNTLPIAGDELIEWSWNFGDGSFADIQNPGHTYDTAGGFTVLLSVTAASGCSNTLANTVEVLNSPQPEFSSDQGCVGFAVNFQNETTIPTGESISSFLWTFESEFSSEIENPSYTFDSSGQNTAMLDVTFINGCSASNIQEINIPASLPAPASINLVYPNSDQVLFDDDVTFRWNLTENFYGFELELLNLSEGVSQSFLVEEAIDSLQLTLDSFGNYSWRVNVFNACRDTTASTLENFTYASLENLNINLNSWFSADNAGNNIDSEGVSSLDNLATNGISISQGEPLSRPVILPNELNGKPVVSFDGIDDFLRSESANSPLAEISLFMVWKTRSGAIQNVIDGIPGSGRKRVYYTTSGGNSLAFNAGQVVQYQKEAPFDYLISTCIYDGENSSAFDNGVLQVSGSIGLSPFGGITMGASISTTFYFDGAIAELIIAEGALNTQDRVSIENYLRAKYFPNLLLPPFDLGADIFVDYGFCPVTIDAGPGYESYLWSTGETSQSIVVLKSGVYSVTVTDQYGYASTDRIEVHYPVEVIDDFAICSNADSLWVTTLELYDVTWQDGTTTSNYLITDSGEYSFSVVDTLLCVFNSETLIVSLDEFPDETELTDIPTFCLGNDLFLSSGFAEAETYLWSTDEVSPFIQPQESGEYWVEATNANGCVGRDTVEVTIAGIAPDTEFDFNPPCAENDVLFNDLTIPEGGTVTEWDWVFENNGAGTSTAENPAIFYPFVGTYPVALTVTLDNGCTGTKRDTVFVNPLPLVNFSAPLICAGNEVFFESFTGVPGGGTIAQWDWSFGNGTVDMGAIGSTSFEVLGFNTVTHIVTTGDACTDSLTRTVEILGSPVVAFDVTDVCLGETVVFEENVDVSISGPVFYNWQFGDGFFSNFPNTSHEYAQAGVYEVTLTATGNNVGVNGCVDQETREIRVYEPPLANSTTTDACIGAAVNLVDISLWRVIEGTTDPVISRQWNILDGPTGSQEGFIGMDSVQTFIPAAAGTFDVGLELATAAGCQASSTGSFLVQAIPSADFDLTLPEINPPFTSVPDNLSEDGINFEWLINGELVSTEFEPTLTFDSAGDYEVVLVATNDLNCTDSAMAMYTVILPEYDIALIELQYQTQGTTLVLNAIISNNGNVVVETFDTEIEVGRDIQFTVVSEFTLPPGDLVDYPLGSDIGYLPGRDLPYTCMRISNPNGQMETDTTNNYLCIGLNDQRATFGDPYPNPAKDEVKLTFVLPEDGPLNVEITGSDGRLMESFILDLKEGLNTVDYPLIGWSEGMYFLKFSYRNQEEVFRLVVAR